MSLALLHWLNQVVLSSVNSTLPVSSLPFWGSYTVVSMLFLLSCMFSFFLKTLLQPITIPGAVNYMGFMCQPVQQSCSHYLIAKYLGPVGEPKIGCDHHRPFLVSFRQDLKKQFRSFLGKRDIPEFVKDKQIIADIPLYQTLQCPLLSCFYKFIDQSVTGDKPCSEVIFTGFNSQSCGHMGLAGAGFSKEYDIAVFLDIAFSCKLPKKPKVQLRDGCKIEGLQRLYKGELCLPEATVQSAF